ncbi:hypothetical protein [Wielerella bovis]|nr:hypothetical protein [Wielerella bovis]
MYFHHKGSLKMENLFLVFSGCLKIAWSWRNVAEILWHMGLLIFV